MTETSRVPWNRIVLVVLLGAVLLMSSRGSALAPPHYFWVKCPYSHTLSDDPIVYPGQPGASHSHDFFGNESTDAFSTYDGLLASPTNCAYHKDTAAYWAPSLIVNGQLQHWGYVRAYYAKNYVLPVTTPPAGEKAIGGDSHATGAQPTSRVSWACGQGTVETAAHPYDCTPWFNPGTGNDGAIAIVRVPRCWNGLDPAVRTNFAYPSSGTGGAKCQAPYTVVLPNISIRFHSLIVDPCGGCLSSDPTSSVSVNFALSSGPWYTMHADFWNTWDQPALDHLIQLCLNGTTSCPTNITDRNVP